jgi:1-acyl-sn-glycerol-3-phosphate acyltransferase
MADAVFYRRTDVTGRTRIALDRPTILAANHGNALADVAVIVAKVPKFPRFLAAATWWKSRPARALFRLGGVVPIHRRRDGESEQNVSTFAACYEELARGAHVCIFPEGEMHLEPSLLPLRTGAARIALSAAADERITGLAIVAVGLVYEDRGRFRSDAEIHFGEPI